MPTGNSKRNILLHILCCSVFLLMPILISTRPPWEPFLTITRPFIRDIIGNALLLAFFYLNYYVLIPRLYYKRKYVLYTGLVLLSLLLIITLPSVFTGRLFSNLRPQPLIEPNLIRQIPNENSLLSFLFNEMKHHLYLFIIAWFFSLILRIREHLAHIKEEKLQAELNSLKSQINPHFLFNTLNSIYALSVKKDVRASEAIINLSGLMRYIIKDALDYTIPLQKEVDYIENYIELQRSRLGNTAKIWFEYSGQLNGKEIGPLILITYIENAFKYGVNPDVDDCIVDVRIHVTASKLNLRVFNKKVRISESHYSTGIGVENTRERLQLLYSGKHQLDIHEDDTTYTVHLIIDLQ
jgi:sensor histidine kinase YesM